VITGVRMNTDRYLLIREYQLISKLFGTFGHQALILCLTVTCKNDFTIKSTHKYFQKYIGWHLNVDCPMTSVTDKMTFLALESYNIVF